jgi:pimeloyl-ACP methyl ester carboxylesterase
MNLQSPKHGRNRSPLLILPGIQGLTQPLELLSQSFPDRKSTIADLPAGGIEEGARELLQAHPLEEGILVGFSYGGLLAWQMTLLEPGRFKGLVLVGTLPSLGAFPAHMALQAKLLPLLPGRLFDVLYAFRHRRQETAGLPSKTVLLSRLRSILGGFPNRPPGVVTLWIYGLDQSALGREAELALCGKGNSRVSLLPVPSDRLHWEPQSIVSDLRSVFNDCDLHLSTK